MKQLLIIPDIHHLQESLSLAREYSLGFEYNDFFHPEVLDDEEKLKELHNTYRGVNLPSYCTLHGAFLDVIPFSPDAAIREIAAKRIEQSIANAEKIGAAAVVFHTNYNPFLNTAAYKRDWIQQNVRFWSGILEKHPGISIYLENMFDTTPDMLKELSVQLCRYKNYGVCLDYAHAALSKTPPQIWVQELGRFVKHVHLNDNDLVSDLHLAWGSGKLGRKIFYDSYVKYMSNATLLIETSSIENQRRSLEVFAEDGFLGKY